MGTAAGAGALYQWRATAGDLASAPPPGRLIDVGGHRLHLWCAGEGTPAVVLESGLGGSSADWGFVQPALAQVTRVCSYDRAGLGYSDPGPSPRTARRQAHELAQLVEKAAVSERVVVAGASLGSFVARVFASEYPARAAGLVLLDGTHEDQTHEVPAIAPLVPLLAYTGVLRLLDVSFGLPPSSLAPSVRGFAEATRFRAAGPRAAASEIMHIQESVAEVKATRRRLAIPLVVVTAGIGSDGRWLELQRDQLAISTDACQIVAPRATHAMATSDPQAVVDAVRLVVEAVRNSRGLGGCRDRR
jgi:pimeloyl-ACP methyl ester carboxylesterase